MEDQKKDAEDKANKPIRHYKHFREPVRATDFVPDMQAISVTRLAEMIDGFYSMGRILSLPPLWNVSRRCLPKTPGK